MVQKFRVRGRYSSDHHITLRGDIHVFDKGFFEGEIMDLSNTLPHEIYLKGYLSAGENLSSLLAYCSARDKDVFDFAFLLANSSKSDRNYEGMYQGLWKPTPMTIKHKLFWEDKSLFEDIMEQIAIKVPDDPKRSLELELYKEIKKDGCFHI